MVIHSYRRVFKVDRRIYRVDRWHLPVPGGVPLRGLAYFGVTLLLIVSLGSLLSWTPVDELPPPLHYVVLPIALAVGCSQIAPDGRPMHRYVLSWVRLRLRAPEQAVHWAGKVKVHWDEYAPELHRSAIKGPAVVTFANQVHVGSRRSGRLVARSGGTYVDRDVVVAPGQELEVRP